MVSIIDYGAGNIKSVENAVRYLGHEAVLTRDPAVILSSDHCILPGVGAFGDAMERLTKFGLDDVIREVIRKEIPFLGICLGLQLLFESSEESPGAKGLGILKGSVLPGDRKAFRGTGRRDLCIFCPLILSESGRPFHSDSAHRVRSQH